MSVEIDGSVRQNTFWWTCRKTRRSGRSPTDPHQRGRGHLHRRGRPPHPGHPDPHNLERHGAGWELMRDGVDVEDGWPRYLARYQALTRNEQEYA
jgi:hypothetical protein